MKEISGRLGAESWALIDTTLRQFILPTTDSWSGTPDVYVLRMIEDATDDVLIDLARHTGYQFENADTPLRVDPPFWDRGMLRLFVSHLAVHKDFAGALQFQLSRYGICAFVAHTDIEPTQEWQTQIETALATCDALLALLHDRFHESNWTDQEIGFAMGRGVPAFAVHFGQTPYGFIGRFQAFNGTGKTSEVLAYEIFDAYRKNKQTQRKMAEAVVSLFEHSSSFAEAKRLMEYLEELTVWEPSFASRIRAAVQNNGQVGSSWGVPNRVEALAIKWSKK